MEGLALKARLDLDGRAGCRLAEEVVGPQRTFDDLAGEVIGPLGLQLHFELRQDVAFDGNGLLGGVVGEHGANAVIAHVDLVGQGEVRLRDAVRRGVQRLLEHLVALAVLDFQRQGRLAHREQIKGAQGQGAKVDGLSGLVERLVRRQQHLDRRLDLHVALEFLFSQGRLRHHFQLVRAGLDVGNREAHRRLAFSIRPAREERIHLVIRPDEVHRDGSGQRDRFGEGAHPVDVAVQGRTTPGNEVWRSKQGGFMRLDEEKLAQGNIARDTRALRARRGKARRNEKQIHDTGCAERGEGDLHNPETRSNARHEHLLEAAFPRTNSQGGPNPSRRQSHTTTSARRTIGKDSGKSFLPFPRRAPVVGWAARGCFCLVHRFAFFLWGRAGNGEQDNALFLWGRARNAEQDNRQG